MVLDTPGESQAPVPEGWLLRGTFSKKMSSGSVYETNYLVHKSCVSLKMSDTQTEKEKNRMIFLICGI